MIGQATNQKFPVTEITIFWNMDEAGRDYRVRVNLSKLIFVLTGFVALILGEQLLAYGWLCTVIRLYDTYMDCLGYR